MQQNNCDAFVIRPLYKLQSHPLQSVLLSNTQTTAFIKYTQHHTIIHIHMYIRELTHISRKNLPFTGLVKSIEYVNRVNFAMNVWYGNLVVYVEGHKFEGKHLKGKFNQLCKYKTSSCQKDFKRQKAHFNTHKYTHQYTDNLQLLLILNAQQGKGTDKYRDNRWDLLLTLNNYMFQCRCVDT